MYWLYVAPSIFAANKHELRPVISDDAAAAHGFHADSEKQDIQLAPGDARNGTHTQNPGEEEPVEDAGDAPQEKAPLVSGQERREREKRRRHTSHRNVTNDEDIVGLCVGRNGHVFVTITPSSLTVWQSKVPLSTVSETSCLLTHSSQL